MLSANLAGSNATMTKDFRSDCVMSHRLLSLLCEALVRSRTAEGSNHRCLSPGPQPPQDDADQLINLTARNSACQNDLERPPRTDCVLWVKGERLFGGVDALGCLGSLRARSALDGVSWVQSGQVEIAVGQRLASATISAPSSAPSLGVAPLGSWIRPPFLWIARAWAGANSVQSRSIACLMIARRRARAILALRIVDRLAIAKAQSLSLSWPL
jgi:hypothetical protein